MSQNVRSARGQDSLMLHLPQLTHSFFRLSNASPVTFQVPGAGVSELKHAQFLPRRGSQVDGEGAVKAGKHIVNCVPGGLLLALRAQREQF